MAREEGPFVVKHIELLGKSFEEVEFTTMANINTLKEIPVEDFEPLLDDLKSDFPYNLHAWSFLKSIERWKASDPTLCVKILALNGDYRSKCIIFYAYTNLLSIQGCAHIWSHKEDDEKVVQEALKNDQEFTWLTDGNVVFTALTEQTDRVVAPLMRGIWKDLDWTHHTGHYLYWMPKEEALRLEIEVPEGTYLANLTDDHAKEVDELWPHRFNGSQELIESVLRFNFGLGLFDSETQELMAWALHWFYGGIGVLQTKEHHVRKGYGTVVLKAITREVARRGDDVHLNVLPDNVASRTLVEKINYHLAFRASWIYRLSS